MSKKISINPLTGIVGHLDISTEAETKIEGRERNAKIDLRYR